MLGTTVGRNDSVLVNRGVNQGPDMSFTFEAPVTGDYTFSTCSGTAYDSLIEVFGFDQQTFGPPRQFTRGYNDDFCGTASSVTIHLYEYERVSCQSVEIRLNEVFRLILCLLWWMASVATLEHSR